MKNQPPSRPLCKHFHGIMSKPPCDKGHDISLYVVHDGRMNCWPCTGSTTAKPCPDYNPPTPAEIAAEEAENKAAFLRVTKAFNAIDNQKGNSGTIKCPNCGGVLHWMRSSYNGHRHARCQTDGCVSAGE